MKIYYIGNFEKLWDEECIARSFEALGHEVIRSPEKAKSNLAYLEDIQRENPDFVLCAKLKVDDNGHDLIRKIKKLGIPTVSWTFDLYFGYPRESLIPSEAFFTCDYVFTTDGGHDEEFKRAGINHYLLRQGIYLPEAFLTTPLDNFPYQVIFVGTNNAHYPQRSQVLSKVMSAFQEKFYWFGSSNTDEIRSTRLNKLYASAKVVVGDSVYSPNYWSNRIYETLGRGGFLIHPEVPGLELEFEYGKELVTYERGNVNDLINKIQYYIDFPDEREDIRLTGFKKVREKYSYQERCKTLIRALKNTGKKG